MQTVLGKYFYCNGQMLPIAEFVSPDPDKQMILYEVIRIIRGVPLFLDAHIRRLCQSAKISKHSLNFDESTLRHAIKELVAQNGFEDCNIKLDLVYAQNNLKKRLIYRIPHIYPATNDYTAGVKTVIYHAERKNPNAKIQRNLFRRQVTEYMNQQQAYEALLVDKNSCITEGSRSNIFFVQNNMLITPPVEAVLPGITRLKVMQLTREAGFECIQRVVNMPQLLFFDAVFITGTSPKILPVNSIDEYFFPVDNLLMRLVIQLYDTEIERYINNSL